MALTLAGGLLWGLHGAVSAALGGLANVTAGWAFGWLVTRRTDESALEALRSIFRAEGAKILVVIAQLWLVLANYGSIVPVSFLGAFVVTALVPAAAIVVKDA